MKFPVQFVVLSILCLATEIDLSEASYECGIRKHGLRPMIHRGWQTEKGSWPWHVGVFHRNTTGQFEYACGGTLVNEWHVLTAAHCVVKRRARKSLPAIMYEIELHFGQHNLSIVDDIVVIRDVKKAHVHPEYTTHRNDIAVLALRLKVEYSEHVIPICLDRKVDRDLRDLEGRLGWVTGWGNTENGTTSEVLRTLSLPVASYIECLEDDPILFGNILNEKVFCAGNLNGTSPSQGDSGGGLFFSDGDRWVLRGIVSTGKMINAMEGIDPNKYIVFVNVQRYLTWMEEVFAESDPPRIRRQKRISEIECERFQSLTAKRPDGECFNKGFPHHVMVVSPKPKPTGKLLGDGLLVNEHNVLTSCSCIRKDSAKIKYRPAMVRIEGYEDVAVVEMFCHPNFSRDDQDPKHYDLAILQFNRNEIELRPNLIPACLANIWTENLYDVLQKTSSVQMENMKPSMREDLDYKGLQSMDTCKKMLDELVDEPLTDGLLCDLKRGPDSSSDYDDNNLETEAEGGVLQSPNRRSCLYTIVGLKRKNDFDRDDSSAVYSFYTRISHYVDWIEEAVWNEKSVDIDVSCGPWDEGYNPWPWSVAIYHWNSDNRSFVFSCSGTLISLKHIVTSAQCLVNRTTGRSLPEDTFELHAGQNFLEQRDINEQIRYVTEVHIHPESPIHDVGILVASWPFRSTIYLSPICLEDPSGNRFPWYADEMLPFISLWEFFEPRKEGDHRKERQLEIIERQQCFKATQVLRGEPLSSNMLCYVFDYGDQVEIMNDLGNGLGVYAQPVATDDDAWHLVGIVSSIAKGNGTSYYVLFVNLKPYIAWIEDIVSQREPRTDERPKRISEKECERFSSLYSKVDGVCENAGDLNHIVLLLNDEHEFVCSGVLVRENRVLTSCECISDEHRPTKIEIKTYGVVDIFKMICHPDYNSTSYYHDFAVLQLVNPVELSSRLIPACLANTRTENLTQTVLYSTFVTTSDARNPRLTSKYDVIGTKYCSAAVDVHAPSQFCIPQFWLYKGILRKTRAVDIDRIQGGYVIQSDNNLTCQFTVIGRGNNMGFETDPGAFVETASRVVYYLDWIEQVVWDEEFSSARQQNWTLVTKGASSAAGRRYSDGLMMSFIALAAIVWKTKGNVH